MEEGHNIYEEEHINTIYTDFANYFGKQKFDQNVFDKVVEFTNFIEDSKLRIFTACSFLVLYHHNGMTAQEVYDDLNYSIEKGLVDEITEGIDEINKLMPFKKGPLLAVMANVISEPDSMEDKKELAYVATRVLELDQLPF